MKLASLDVNELRALIHTLELALKGVYSTFTSSPVDLLLESAIDLSLLLSNEFLEGGKINRKNPGLKFLDQISDPLGNPKQIRLNFESDVLWDPQAAQFFKRLAGFFVRLRRGDAFNGAFMALMEDIPEPSKRPPVSGKLIPPEERKKLSKGRPEALTPGADPFESEFGDKQKTTREYWRRQRRRNL
jgi:hypothetical protein